MATVLGFPKRTPSLNLKQLATVLRETRNGSLVTEFFKAPDHGYGPQSVLSRCHLEHVRGKKMGYPLRGAMVYVASAVQKAVQSGLCIFDNPPCPVCWRLRILGWRPAVLPPDFFGSMLSESRERERERNRQREGETESAVHIAQSKPGTFHSLSTTGWFLVWDVGSWFHGECLASTHCTKPRNQPSHLTSGPAHSPPTRSN